MRESEGVFVENYMLPRSRLLVVIVTSGRKRCEALFRGLFDEVARSRESREEEKETKHRTVD